LVAGCTGRIGMTGIAGSTGMTGKTFRPRVIPVLLLKDGLLYKTEKFRNPKYVGDPRVAVKIFNDKGADEIAIIDILATREGRQPDFQLIEEIAGESFMPLGYGGGIRTRGEVRRILSLGAEKVIINTRAVEDPDFVRAVSEDNGAQSITICIDVKKDLFGRSRAMTHCGQTKTSWDPAELAQRMEEAGAGELIVQSIDREGTMSGYDLKLTRSVAEAVAIPVIALGGAGSEQDLARAVKDGGASAAAAGAMFVFQGPHRAILITYPDDARLGALLDKARPTEVPAA
jgi:cyclase